MKIKELTPRMGKINIILNVESIGEIKPFEQYGEEKRVANAECTDGDGQRINVPLWNDEIDIVFEGAKIKITNGYCSEFQGEKQISAGKFGKLEVVNEKDEKIKD